MTRFIVPYHIDEYLPGLGLTEVAGPARTITASLTAPTPWQRLAQLYEVLAAAVADAARAGGRPVIYSGDCTTALGTVAGLQRAGIDPAIVWFDGHGDVQTMQTTESGYLGGMPLRVLVGYRPDGFTDQIGLRAVAEHRVVLTDARDLDAAEVAYLASAAIRRCPVSEVARKLPDGPLYLHLDLDVVDPAALHGLRFPAPAGPDLAAVVAAAGQVLATGQVVAFGVACTWHPGGGDPAGVREHLGPLLATWE